MPDRILGMRLNFVLFVLIVLYTIAPILSVLLSSVIANSLGCRLDEGNVHPCDCLGVDIGGLLTMMGILGWLTLITLPTGLIALAVFSIYLVVSALLKLTRAKDRDRLYKGEL